MYSINVYNFDDNTYKLLCSYCMVGNFRGVLILAPHVENYTRHTELNTDNEEAKTVLQWEWSLWLCGDYLWCWWRLNFTKPNWSKENLIVFGPAQLYNTSW